MMSEKERLHDENWKKWGPYVSNRQWGTVREDYSHNGNAWGHTTYNDAISRAYRWNEDGIAGICDDKQLLCFAFSFWNRKDKMIKERLITESDIFVHYTEIQKVYKSFISPGLKFSFDVFESNKGPQAKNIEIQK